MTSPTWSRTAELDWNALYDVLCSLCGGIVGSSLLTCPQPLTVIAGAALASYFWIPNLMQLCDGGQTTPRLPVLLTPCFLMRMAALQLTHQQTDGNSPACASKMYRDCEQRCP